MKHILSVLLTALMIFSLSVCAFAKTSTATYYIDSENGSDEYCGTTKMLP